MHDATTTGLIADAIESVGLPAFPAALAALCQHASGHTSTFIAAYFTSHPPVKLFDNLDPKQSATTLSPYLDFAYILDPFYDLFRTGFGDGVVRLSDCAPDDFRSSDYFQRFYAETGLLDETGIFIRFGNQAAVIVSLGSREDAPQDPKDATDALTPLVPILVALCHRHWPQMTPESVSTAGRLRAHLEKSFNRFGTSILSDREAEIARLILKGHSSKSIARRLGNSPETIKVHRKRIHVKLGVASQGELFSLFLEALTEAPPNATEDPLIYLQPHQVPSSL